MSADANTWIGVLIPVKNLRKFRKHVPAKKAKEARYDPKTGKKLESVIVVVEDEHDLYKIGEREFEINTENCWDSEYDIHEIGDALAELIEARDSYLYLNHGESLEDGAVLVGESLCGADGDGEWYRMVGSGSGINPTDMNEKVGRWASNCHRLGIKIADSGLFTTLTVGD